MKRQSNRGFGTFEALCVMAALAVALTFLAIDNPLPDTSLEEVGRQQYLTNIAAYQVMTKWNTAVASGAVDLTGLDVESKVWTLVDNTDLGLDTSVSKDLSTGRVRIDDLSELLEVVASSGRLRWR